MARPPLEVADLIRAAGTTFFEGSRKWFTWLHLKILTAIVCCRTSTLGGHIDQPYTEIRWILGVPSVGAEHEKIAEAQQ